VFVKGQDKCIQVMIRVGSGKTAMDEMIPKGSMLAEGGNGAGG